MSVGAFFSIICMIVGVVGASMLFPLATALFCREQGMIFAFAAPMAAAVAAAAANA